MVGVADGWVFNVTRGPDWLFVRLKTAPPDQLRSCELAECLWSLSEQHFIYRLVVELDEIPLFDQEAIEQLCLLRDRIEQRGGVLRLCGVSAASQRLFEHCQPAESFACYQDRAAAVRRKGR